MNRGGVMAGTVGRFAASAPELERFRSDAGGPDLRVLDTQPTVVDDSATTLARAACRVEETRQQVTVDDTLVDIGRESELRTWGTELARRGRVVVAESTVEESGGAAFPFTLLSAVTNVRCERLAFDTDAIQRAWGDDGTLAETWLEGSRAGDGTVMAYGEKSSDDASNIGLGFERSWDGHVLRGVVYASGWVCVYADLAHETFLRFVTEELVPFGFVPENDDGDDGEQSTLGGG